MTNKTISVIMVLKDKTMEKEMKFTLRIKKSLVDKLDRICDTEHRSRNEQINKIIWDYVYQQIDNSKRK